MVAQLFKPAGGILGGLGGYRHPIVVGLELLGGLSPLRVILVVFADDAGQEQLALAVIAKSAWKASPMPIKATLTVAQVVRLLPMLMPIREERTKAER